MLQLDDVQLYDLSEAGGLLFKDPARLTREARQQAIPSARLPEGVALPAPWVEAEAGVSNADAISLCSYWLARLAPPSREARRPRRELDRLEAGELIDAAEAARRLCATPSALERLDREGVVPSLRVEDAVRYDAVLVDLVAGEDDGDAEDLGAARAATEARRALVRGWARFEYGVVNLPPPAPIPVRMPTPTPSETTDAEPALSEPATDAPKAFEIPTDLGLDAIDDMLEEAPPSTLMEIDGFETVDED